MTKPKRTNGLYYYFRGAINNALSLEYAIRAADNLYPKKMMLLRRLANDLVTFWLEQPIGRDTVGRYHLLDYSFDRLQFDTVLVRRDHFDISEDDFIKPILDSVNHYFIDKYLDCEMPALYFFRAADLSFGNNIVDIYKEYSHYKDLIEAVEPTNSAPKEIIPKVAIREPIHIHPALKFYGGDSFLYEGKFGASFDLNYKLSKEDFFLTMREFMYQYATWCGVDFKNDKSLTKIVITDYLNKEFRGELGKKHIKRHDGLHGPLLGLICYDKHVRENMLQPDAIEETMKLSDVAFDTVRGYYQDVYAEVEKYELKFKQILE